MKTAKNLLFAGVMMILLFSAFQKKYRAIPEPELTGFYKLKEVPSLRLFSPENWKTGYFQDEYSRRLEDHIGFRNSLFRLNNQLDFSLFGITHAEGFIRGKKNFLFEEDYIREYTGDYFIGKAVIDQKVNMLKMAQDSLAKYGIPLIPVFEPGKASFFPEYIPARYHPQKKSLSNYEYFVQRAKETGLLYLDLNRAFLQMKDTSRFPLFPAYGMHWSLYGAAVAVDTLSSYIQHLKPGSLPEFRIGSIMESDIPRGTDYDIAEVLNVMCALPPTPGAYPETTIENSPEKRKLRVLVIADSYYLNILEPYGRKLFRSQEYWYYNQKLYPRHNVTPPLYVNKSDLLKKLKKFDLILLMSSEINLHCAFWNFADEAFYAFRPWPPQPALARIANDIRNDREWFRFMVAKSRSNNKPLDEMITDDARFMFFTTFKDIPWKSYLDTIDFIGLEIRQNADWLEAVKKKALDNNVPLDEMITRDATYTYEQKRAKKW